MQNLIPRHIILKLRPYAPTGMMRLDYDDDDDDDDIIITINLFLSPPTMGESRSCQGSKG